MNGEAESESEGRVEPERRSLGGRQERAQRILDAAGALILRWGYNKTTMDDIARQAGVAKGTIYLHWRTREDLFTALITREGLAWADDVRRCVAHDPAAATLRGMLRCSALHLLRRPLLKAVVLQDMDVIGKLAIAAPNGAVVMQKMAGFEVYLQILRAHGLLRADLDLRSQVYIVTAVFIGFLRTAPLLGGDLALSDEQLADLIGDTIHRVLESGRNPSPEELEAVRGAFEQYLDGTLAAVQQFRRAQGLD